MEYAVLLSVILYVSGCFYLFLGIYAIISNVKSRTNRLFLYLTLSMMMWSFTYSIATSAPTAGVSAFWHSMSIFGRGVFFSLLLHFIIMLTKFKIRFKNKHIIIFLIYLPAIINIILFAPFGFLVKETYQMVTSDFGWVNEAPISFGKVWINLYYLIYSVTSIILIINWLRKLEPHTTLKRLATYFLISILASFLIGTAVDILPEVLGLKTFPKITTIFLMSPATLLFISLKRFGLLLEKSKTVILFPKSDFDVNKDRMRLFLVTAVLFMVGGVVTFMIGYFGIKRTLEYELFISSLIFVTGVFLIFLPRITKSHSIQNALFLIVCSISAVFLMVTNTDTGAVTIWAAYIIFLLITVVLESKIHALIFTIFAIVLQISFWIFIPEITVTIDGNEYITRIFIIFLSYFTVRYLTNEYGSKLRGYQRFAKEQETLERISSNFISVNSENSYDKINEMFKMAAEVLDFNQGYLVRFIANSDDAMIINAYAKDGVIGTFPFPQNVRVKAADFVVNKTLITQKQPVGCTDITSLSIDEDKEERNFFEKRGVHSYYALPIIVDDKIVAILVAEDHKKADLRIRESQINFLGVLANILTDTRKKIIYEEKLYKSAYFDEITKLANRNMLTKRLTQRIHDIKALEKIAVLYIEIENLRMINDTFGHIIGDKILVKSAEILKDLLGEYCCLSRAENGAFVVVVPIVKTVDEVLYFIEKIMDAFSVPILPTERIETLFVTVAIGISVYPDDGMDADTLLQNADLAAYEAKHSDNKVVFCSDQLKDRIAENTLLTNRLFTAMQNDEFSLEFQPQISSKTGKTVGVEALLRWNYDDKKRIRPDIFIPILEQTGLIHDVGLWVLEQSLKEHKRLIEKGFSPLRFSVNLSIIQIKKDDFVLEIIKLIKDYEVDPKYIELEITESFLSSNFADTIMKLTKLKEFGISIAIDDFGKGYSSLHRLELVPFDRIKIDKSIVDDIILEKKKIVIVETIVSLAKALMAHITAEGVETKEQLDFLKNMDCDEIQGYYYSKPLPIETLEKFLEKE